jgi:hypothetical protein
MTYALSELLRAQLELTENFLNSQKKLYTGFVNSLNTAALQQQQHELFQRQQQRHDQQQLLKEQIGKETTKTNKKESRSRKNDHVSFPMIFFVLEILCPVAGFLHSI